MILICNLMIRSGGTGFLSPEMAFSECKVGELRILNDFFTQVWLDKN
jgi:hypothetical protein